MGYSNPPQKRGDPIRPNWRMGSLHSTIWGLNLKRHRRDGDHSGEGFHRRLAKAAILHWADEHPAVLSAAKEVAVGDRVADVLIEGVGGFVIAVEIQYSAIDLTSWRERDQSYRDQGITPIWLWGHIGHHSPSGMVTPRAVHREILRARQPLMWINPHDEQIAWAATYNGMIPDPDEAVLSPQISPLDSRLILTSEGIHPVGWQEARESWRRLQQDKARAAATHQRFVEDQRKIRSADAERRQLRLETLAARIQVGDGPICDVCKRQVRSGQARVGGRHEVCNYGL